ncbi:MAG: signal peptidase II [Alphaproteobacteria bacterium]|nr:signal peptidase II [Alphaproteobacteria bacterium]
MKKILKILAGVFGIVLIDQITKGVLLLLLAGSMFIYGAKWLVVPFPYLISQVNDFFNIVFTWNPGTAFSLFRNIGENLQWVVIGFTGVVIGLILYYLLKRAAAYERVPLILIAGGALGNMVDRLRFGAVIDFLDFHIGGLHWPAFNFADICISAGVLLYVLNWFLARRRCLRNAKGEK